MSKVGAARIVFSAAIAYTLAVSIAGAYVRYALWSDRELVNQLLDNTWQIELAWRAALGEWSGRDFHYPMGPLWQALLWAGSGGLPMDARRMLVGTQLLFSLLCVAATIVFAWRVADQSWKRVAVFVAGAALCFAAGPATLRAVVSTAVVLLYSAGEDAEPTTKRDLPTALAVCVALLLSFDRALLAVVCIVAMSAYELVARYRRRDRPKLALRRLARWAVVQLACLAGLAVVAMLCGANPLGYLRGQQSITADYGPALGIAWKVGVRKESIIFFVAAAVLIALAMLLVKKSRWRGGVLIAGTLPTMAFAVVQPDQGHVFLALAPTVLVLALVALDPRAHSVSSLADRPARAASAVLAYFFMVGWFVTYPEAFWISPRAFFEAIATYRGEKRPQVGYATDLGAALAALPRGPAAGCLATSPPLAALHPLTGRRGPTELPLMWSYARLRERSDAIARARCPELVHFFVAYDTPDHPGGWRTELITEAENYRFERQLSPATYLMRLREKPEPLRRQPLAVVANPPATTIAVPGEIRFRLERPIPGDHALEIEYTYRFSTPALRLGGRPFVDVTFEKDGQEVGAFSAPIRFPTGERARAVIGSDPEAFERRLIRGLAPLRQSLADTIRIKLSPTGLFSPKSAEIELHTVTELSAAEPGAGPEPECVKDLDLIRTVEQGAALERDFAPVNESRGLWISANPPGDKIAEVSFPVRPCRDACFRTDISVKQDSGDGVDLEAHVLDRENRTRLLLERLPAGHETRGLELPLYPWSEREVLLRVGLRPGDDVANNALYIHAPRIERCSCRRRLADALREGVARVTKGNAWANGDDVAFATPGGEIVEPLTPLVNTCFSTEVVLEGLPPEPADKTVRDVTAVVSAHFKLGALRHRLFRALLDRRESRFELKDHSLHDYLGKQGELVITAEVPRGFPDLRAVLRHARVGRCFEP